MCAGRCREPRRKGTRVAAPSGCIVPWAARASCWPQPQQLLPVSAAGSGRRCCTGAFPRRTIRRVDAVRIHPCSPFSRQIKQKLQYPVRILESLVGAGGLREPRRKGARVAAPSGCIVPWAARASCWPQPQQLLPVSAAGSGRRCCTGAFFPAGLFGGSMLFSSTLVVHYKVQIKQKLQRHNNAGVLGGRGWITRAAHLKKPRRGFFPRRTVRRVDAVRIHPLGEINFVI